MVYEYRLDAALRRASLREPHVALARNQMATAYRRMRQARPEMARLLLRHLKRAEQAAIKAFWSTGAGHHRGGLNLIVRG